MADIPESATEIVADMADEVAEHAHQFAEVSRGLAGRDLGFVFGGLLLGAAAGAVGGYHFAKRRLETKYSQITADEVAEMQRHYHEKLVALENQVEKPKLEQLIRDRGYSPAEDEDEEEELSSSPPMAVTPPKAVVDRAGVAESEDEVAGEPPEPDTTDDRAEVRNVFKDAKVEDHWDAHRERAQRSPVRPYVIHIDEREELPNYETATLTYFEEDDVLCDESDEVIAEGERESTVGEANLEKFGHGSGDANVVYIRNDRLSTVFTVMRSPNSFMEEVHGFTPDPPEELRHSHSRRGRQSFDDE